MKRLQSISISLALVFFLIYPLPSAAFELSIPDRWGGKQEGPNGGKDPVNLALNYPEGSKPADGGPPVEYGIGIVGDVNFTTKSRERAHNAFFLGEVDIYSTLSYGDRLSFLGEFVLESEGSDKAEVDIERLWIGYTFSDLLTLRAGRHHTAIGHWNKQYHHGKHLFVSIERPFILEYEDSGGIMPLHIVGLEFGGRRRFGFGMLKYEFNLGNGPTIDQQNERLKINNSSDDNDAKQVSLRIYANPATLPGLDIGISGTVFTVDTSTVKDLDERVYAFDAAYRYKGLEVMGEFFRLSNSVATGDAWYLHASHSGIMGHFTPYARFEKLDVDENDPYFRDLGIVFDRYQAIAGVRYDMDIIPSAVKIQYRYDDTRDGNDFNVFELQWSFGF